MHDYYTLEKLYKYTKLKAQLQLNLSNVNYEKGSSMSTLKCKLTAKHIGLVLAVGILSPINSYAGLSTEETQKYLIIATGDGFVFDSDGAELGANQEVVSSSNPGDSNGPGSGQIHGDFPGTGLNLHDTFIPSTDKPGVTENDTGNNNRWVNNDSVEGGVVGTVDYLPGAKNLREAPDYSGNIAITSISGKFVSENSDYFASIGIECEGGVNCFKSVDNDNSWNQDGTGANDGFTDLDKNNGVFDFDSSALLTELDDWRTTIDSLTTDVTWTMEKIDNTSYGHGTSPLITDLDAIDINNDGYAVINIGGEAEKDFIVSNTDWILKSLNGTKAIFRMDRDAGFQFNNSSIMMGCESYDFDANDKSICQDDDLDELGAIFYTSDEYQTYTSHAGNPSNPAFDLSNVILGGVGLWDLDSKQNTDIVINNAQGCTQLISSQVHLSSTTRFNRCSLTAQVPLPSTLFLLSATLFGFIGNKGRMLFAKSLVTWRAKR